MATWFYESFGAQQGPVSESELRSLYARGAVRGETLVWQDGMPDWQPLGEVLPGFLTMAPAPPPVVASQPMSPGYAEQSYMPIARRVENHLAKAILVTLFCCLPLGIVSIVYAAQVNGRAEAGDYAEAERLSDQANAWANWSIGLGLAWIVIAFMIAMAS